MKKVAFLAIIIGLGITTITTQSCKKDDNPSPVTPAPTLYDSLGGTTLVADPTAAAGTTIEAGRLLIRNIIDSTIFVIAGDNAINGHFTVLLAEVTAGNLSGFQELSKNLTDFVAAGTGSTHYTYSGLSMVAAHNPAQNPRMNNKATNADMNAFEADLFTGAGRAGVPSTTPALISVGRIVESLRSQVVQM